MYEITIRKFKCNYIEVRSILMECKAEPWKKVKRLYHEEHT